MMERIKVSDNFYLDEFIHPRIYSLFSNRSMLFIRPELFKIAQIVRNQFGPCEINNWSQGGKINPRDFLNLPAEVKEQYRKESGLRLPDTSTGAKYSMHKYGCAIDIHPLHATPEEIRQFVRDNYDKIFKNIGLKRMETDTPTWVHLDIGNTGLDRLVLFAP